jgi:hypothetical protein
VCQATRSANGRRTPKLSRRRQYDSALGGIAEALSPPCGTGSRSATPDAPSHDQPPKMRFTPGGFRRKISLSLEGNSVSFSVPPANRCLSSAAPGTGRPAHVAGRFFYPPTRQNRNQELRREIRISKLEIRKNWLNRSNPTKAGRWTPEILLFGAQTDPTGVTLVPRGMGVSPMFRSACCRNKESCRLTRPEKFRLARGAAVRDARRSFLLINARIRPLRTTLFIRARQFFSAVFAPRLLFTKKFLPS